MDSPLHLLKRISLFKTCAVIMDPEIVHGSMITNQEKERQTATFVTFGRRVLAVSSLCAI